MLGSNILDDVSPVIDSTRLSPDTVPFVKKAGIKHACYLTVVHIVGIGNFTILGVAFALLGFPQYPSAIN